MKTEKNILIAFILNISFSVIEFLGGIFTNSVAIISDSIHDFGDALSIGISYFLEKKSKKHADKKYTYGYTRYSVLGGVITTTILLVGSILVIYGAFKRLLNPVDINYQGMIVFAVIGVILNFIAAYVTRDGESINQKAVIVIPDLKNERCKIPGESYGLKPEEIYPESKFSLKAENRFFSIYS